MSELCDFYVLFNRSSQLYTLIVPICCHCNKMQDPSLWICYARLFLRFRGNLPPLAWVLVLWCSWPRERCIKFCLLFIILYAYSLLLIYFLASFLIILISSLSPINCMNVLLKIKWTNSLLREQILTHSWQKVHLTNSASAVSSFFYFF